MGRPRPSWDCPFLPPFLQGHVRVGCLPRLAVFSVLIAPHVGEGQDGPLPAAAREMTQPRSHGGARLQTQGPRARPSPTSPQT